jgi:putative holliday junction resolvase
VSAPKVRDVQTVVAFDWGEKRTGVAVGNALTRSATPLRSIEVAGDARWQRIDALRQEWQPDAWVVGRPCHPDGQAHTITERCEKFARQLHGRTGLAVHLVDERYSSTEAQSQGARDVDAVSAQLIAEQYLRSLP